MRDLTSDVQTAISADNVRPILLFEGEFGSGFVRVWSGIGDLVWSARTWSGIGTLGGISSITESSDVQANGITVTLSGIPSDLISVALADVVQGKLGKVYFGFMDFNNSLLVDPVLMFEGRIDVPSIEDGGDSSILQISYESRLIDLQKARESRYTHEDQKVKHPTDLGFQFVPALQELQITWGKADSNSVPKTKNVTNDTDWNLTYA